MSVVSIAPTKITPTKITPTKITPTCVTTSTIHVTYDRVLTMNGFSFDIVRHVKPIESFSQCKCSEKEGMCEQCYNEIEREEYEEYCDYMIQMQD
jgi:hypothetical protein